MPERVWLPHGSRMDTELAVTDRAIQSLRGFIVQTAEALARGEPLAGAVRVAARSHPAALSAFDFERSDAELERSFALRDELSFPDEPLPQALLLEQRDRSASF